MLGFNCQTASAFSSPSPACGGGLGRGKKLAPCLLLSPSRHARSQVYAGCVNLPAVRGDLPRRTRACPGFALSFASRAGPTCGGRGQESSPHRCVSFNSICQTANVIRPVLRQARARLSSSFPRANPRAWSAEKAHQQFRACERGARLAPQTSLRSLRKRPRDAPASRRSTAAIFGVGTVLPGADGIALIQAAFAALLPHLVQPLKAAPHSWSGRLTRGLPEMACEAHPQAPHQPAPGLPGSGPLKLLRQSRRL